MASISWSRRGRLRPTLTRFCEAQVRETCRFNFHSNTSLSSISRPPLPSASPYRTHSNYWLTTLLNSAASFRGQVSAQSVSLRGARTCPELGVKPTCRLSARTSHFDPTVWTGRALQAGFETNGGGWSCASVSGPCMERLCSWPSWISARTRSHSEKGPERPLGSPDHGYDGETVSPFPQSNSQTSAGIFLAC